MAIRQIITEEDARLRKKSREVEDVSSPKIQELIQDMKDTLADSENGIGLAAVQVGMLKRIFVINMQEGSGTQVYINPEFLTQEGEQTDFEGCLSLPGYSAVVCRPARVKIRALNERGEVFEKEATGLEAVCMCHEYDHLEGILFSDREVPGTGDYQ